MNKDIELKMDAHDQLQLLKEAIEEADKPKKPIWPKPVSVIAGQIASNFYPATSLFHADLRRKIIDAMDEDRRIALGQFDEK